MTPTIGRIVHYIPSEKEKKIMAKTGNKSDLLPAIITAVWSDDCVNLKVICDGTQNMWITSAQKGTDENNWHWPEIK